MIKGTGSVSLTNESGSGPGGPKTYGSYGSEFGSATLCIGIVEVSLYIKRR